MYNIDAPSPEGFFFVQETQITEIFRTGLFRNSLNCL